MRPELIWRLLEPDDPTPFEDAVRRNRGFLSKMFGMASKSDAAPVDLTFVEGETTSIDLDKAWHGIHYCLNRTAEEAPPPMDFIVSGGRAAGKEDVGYGYARLLTSREVADIHQRISQVTELDLRKNYEPEEMDKLEIYPEIWTRDGEFGFEYIADYFRRLKEFIQTSVDLNLGMAVYFC
jgi:hypothetical protein